jgi:hypothetical protein
MLSRPSLFVELLYQGRPVPLQGTKEFGHTNPYLGIGTNRDKLRTAQEKVHNKGYDASFIIVSDISEVGLADNMASEVFIADFISDSISESKRNRVKKILAMSKVILPEGGKLTLLETKRPPSPSSIRELVEDSDYEVEAQITGDDPSWETMVDPYFQHAPRESIESGLISSLTIARNKKPGPDQ